MIHLRGGPGVETQLLLPEPAAVRFLQFGLQTQRLVCLGKSAFARGNPETDLIPDNGHRLHVWDLSALGSPKYMTTVRWDSTTYELLYHLPHWLR